jgi:hypothetical protein
MWTAEGEFATRDSFRTPIRIRENAFSDPANFASIVKFREQHVSCGGIVQDAWIAHCTRTLDT